MSNSTQPTPSAARSLRIRNDFPPPKRTRIACWTLIVSFFGIGSFQCLRAENAAPPITGLDFRLLGPNGRDQAPLRRDARTAFAAPLAAESLDFRVLGPTSKPDEAVPDQAIEQLDFRVMGPVQAEDVSAATRVDPPKAAPTVNKPIVYVYTADLRSCAPCKRLHDELHALDQEVLKSLPFRFVWRSPPAWVKGTPTLHWNDAAGAGRTLEYGEWKGIEGFRRLFETTQKKKTAANTRSSTQQTSSR